MADKVEIEKAKSERWWSAQARNHVVEVITSEGPKTARFNKYALHLDLLSDEGQQIAEGLRKHPQNGRSFYLIGGQAAENERGRRQKIEMLRMLRKIASDNVIEGRIRVKAVEQLRAIFSNEELAKAKIDASSMDCDALMQLAIETKTLIGLE